MYGLWGEKTSNGLDRNWLLRTYTRLMEDKMAAGHVNLGALGIMDEMTPLKMF